MNTDQKANIDAAVLALGQNLACAWSYFHLLRGIDQGSRQNPEVIERFGLLYDRAWRAVFDGFFAKVGTLLDNTRGTHSLPNLVTLIRRYGSAELKQLIQKVESSLTKKDSSLSKLRNWRHDAVAHHAADRDPNFYTDNKMTLSEIEDALVQLEALLNICLGTSSPSTTKRVAALKALSMMGNHCSPWPRQAFEALRL